MADVLKRDQNHVTVLGAVTDDSNQDVTMLRVDPTTKRLLVAATGSGAGSVTSVSVVTANGFSGTVANPTTTPAITINASALDATKIADGSVSNTEFQYLDGVSSNIQTQINAKGSGTVTAVSVATANGVSGSSSGGATPALTITLGAITPTTVNGLTISTTTGTFTLTNGKTFAVTHGLTLSGTDSTVMTFPSTSATIARTDAANSFTGASTASAWVLTAPTITTSIVPTANDGAALGSTGNQFSDLFLAEGGVINWDNGDATITQTGNDITIAGISTFSVGTSTAVTLGTIELGDASDTTIARASAGVISVEGITIPSISSTNTLTNKRITKRVGTTASSATPTINTDNVDVYSITALAAAITSFTSNLSGTPVNGDTLEINITDDGTARGITWGASFESSGNVTLPSTTVISTRLDIFFVWNTATTKWRCVAVS